MATKILGLDLGTSSIGWAIIDPDTKKKIGCGAKTLPATSTVSAHRKRIFARAAKRKRQRFAFTTRTLLLTLQGGFIKLVCEPVVRNITKITFPVFIHSLLAVLFTGSLLMAIINREEFQFWLNMSVTILLGWIVVRK